MKNIQNIWLRRTCIVPLYAISIPVATILMIAHALWETLCDLLSSAKQNFSEVAVDFVVLHMDIGKLWRGE
ncbi:MAG: hypothetical protein ACMZ66_05445 [Thalassospira sp.]|uniref:hypothetical protein n=1 Tax=Thalassospira sp. TaxID=1912094 RepID=UPI003A868DAC